MSDEPTPDELSHTSKWDPFADLDAVCRDIAAGLRPSRVIVTSAVRASKVPCGVRSPAIAHFSRDAALGPHHAQLSVHRFVLVRRPTDHSLTQKTQSFAARAEGAPCDGEGDPACL